MDRESNKLKITTTIDQEDMEYLQAEVLNRSKNAGKMLNMSHVLREILHEHRENQEVSSNIIDIKEKEKSIKYTYILNMEVTYKYFFKVEVSLQDIRQYQSEYNVSFDEAERQVAEMKAVGIYMNNLPPHVYFTELPSSGGTIEVTDIVRYLE